MIKLFYLFFFNAFESTFFVFYLHLKQYFNMFYNDLYMKSLGLILLQPLLLDFCFKNLDLSDIQLARLNFCLITLFVIVTFLNQYN